MESVIDTVYGHDRRKRAWNRVEWNEGGIYETDETSSNQAVLVTWNLVTAQEEHKYFIYSDPAATKLFSDMQFSDSARGIHVLHIQ